VRSLLVLVIAIVSVLAITSLNRVDQSAPQLGVPLSARRSAEPPTHVETSIPLVADVERVERVPVATIAESNQQQSARRSAQAIVEAAPEHDQRSRDGMRIARMNGMLRLAGLTTIPLDYEISEDDLAVFRSVVDSTYEEVQAAWEVHQDLAQPIMQQRQDAAIAAATAGKPVPRDTRPRSRAEVEASVTFWDGRSPGNSTVDIRVLPEDVPGLEQAYAKRKLAGERAAHAYDTLLRPLFKPPQHQ
jgi:hypothetical protein